MTPSRREHDRYDFWNDDRASAGREDQEYQQWEADHGRRERGRPRWVASVVAVFTVSAVLCAAWYWVSGTPEFSLYRLSAAIDNRDVDEVERYVDLDRVSDNVADIFFEAQRIQKSQRLSTTTEPWQKLGEQMAEGLIELMKPALKARFRDELRTQVRKEVEEGKRAARSVLPVPTGIIGTWRQLSVDQDGRLARIIIRSEAGQEARLRMVQRSDRRWKIVGLDSEWVRELFAKAGLEKK